MSGVQAVNHAGKVKRSGEGVIGTCACRQRQAKPVATRAEAEDWIFHHLEQVRRARAGEKQLSGPAYLAYLQERAADSTLTERVREQWQMLADEQARRTTAPPPRGDLPASKNAKYNTGVATEPLFEV